VTAYEDTPHFATTTTLDIEAPTKLDRDKFARAFSRFLNVPLVEVEQYPIIQQQQQQQQPLTTGGDMRSVRSDMTPQSYKGKKKISLQPK
jgi:hypothetical protein